MNLIKKSATACIPRETWSVAGLMSGTSLDGLDVVLCELMEVSGHWSFEILHGTTINFPQNLRKRLSEASLGSALGLVKLDFDFGSWCGNRLLEICEAQKFVPEFVASHGHTIFHQPDSQVTCQIGNGHSLAMQSGFPVVTDFRSADVVAGGQGAPLVPVGDQLLFGQYPFCLNLGGIANISFVTNDGRIAFDIVPMNMVLNHLAQRLNFDCDRDGIIASQGAVLPNLLEKLNQWGYLHLKPPKSLAREQVDSEVLPLFSPLHNTADLLHTCVVFVAQQIAAVINGHAPGDVLITGGGANNIFFVDTLRLYCPEKLVVPDQKVIDYKEALVFALLGILRWTQRPNIFASVTGAPHDHCGGVIYFPPRTSF